MTVKASELYFTITCSNWRATWGLRAVGLAMRISPNEPRLKRALRRAAIKLINWGTRFRVNGKRIKTPQLVTEAIFD